MKNIFHKGHEKARDKYNTKANADYWLETLDTSKLNSAMMEFIENCSYFFFATASPDGQPNLNYKGGEKGFLHVVKENKLVFPNFKGNGILHSLGDLELNNKVSLLIPDFNQDVRLKIIGKATVVYENVYISEFWDYFSAYKFDSLIMIDIEYVIPNCPSNLHRVRDSILNFTEEDKDISLLPKLMGRQL
ncbi:pyridoxamine 5'-phosphate oxidase family protein [Sulfurovum sp. NBC37-1]|uniref:pyridoxamine 5'-phosphate oxidase family protein n=1 Tax=Sulfurovum sp. (strain NBC37-1) TaxID=387093 RepID=UPI000158769A|nr:pyridoxamine 5'-phosphate oxidase family protein [Sulfurovum sp. NBC37-1]BAF71891.1 pyridoxamine 5'-phosphate oxidase [Sulfurovum sp. NBC37-1]